MKILFGSQINSEKGRIFIESVTLFLSLWVISCEYEMKGDLENNPELGRFYENHDLWQPRYIDPQVIKTYGNGNENVR